MDLRNKKVTILGLGRSGFALAELIDRLYGKVQISEKAPADAFKAQFEKWGLRNKVQVEFGGHTESFIQDSDLVVLSPGVRIDAQPLQWASKKGIPAIGEIELAWQFCRCPVVAVTGSNGKTTVSTLIAEVLKRSGKRVCLCGNIGSPFSKHVLDSQNKDFLVLEISSFQLETIVDFRPHVAVFLNFSQNHLDRHKDMEEYFNAKKRIFSNQTPGDYAVLNYENPMIRNLGSEIKAKVSYFNAPQAIKNTAIYNPNYLAVITAAGLLGVSLETCRQVFADFKGIEHRLEWVRTLGGVDFINDSKSTTDEAGRWALQTIEKPIVMICGGYDKHIDFSPLREIVRKKVKKMFVMGATKNQLQKAFGDVVSVTECGNLEEAVRRARENAQQNDCVLFSPMCASFDMFKNFEERGKIFKEIVHKL